MIKPTVVCNPAAAPQHLQTGQGGHRLTPQEPRDFVSLLAQIPHSHRYRATQRSRRHPSPTNLALRPLHTYSPSPIRPSIDPACVRASRRLGPARLLPVGFGCCCFTPQTPAVAGCSAVLATDRRLNYLPTEPQLSPSF